MAAGSWAASFGSSGWQDPLDDLVRTLLPVYGSARRDDLDHVRPLVTPGRPHRRVAVVGTNGKTSTATLLARLLTSAGVRSGLYTSPHVASWTERVRVDGVPVAADALREALLAQHARAPQVPEGLRFFDVLTLAAEDLFAAAEVDVAVLEAGIGGRLDAVAALDPGLTVLTSIGRDHEELLGADPADRLREKALMAPPGGRLLAPRLGDGLDTVLERLCGERGVVLERVEDGAVDVPGAPPALAASAGLALAAARLLGAGVTEDDARRAVAEGVLGRFERGERDGVPWTADVAHNPTAWAALLAQLPPQGCVLVVAITEPRSVADLVAEVLAARDRVRLVVATRTTVRASRSPQAIAEALVAAGLPAQAVERDPFGPAFAQAAALGVPVVVTGSSYLVTDFLAWTSVPTTPEEADG